MKRESWQIDVSFLEKTTLVITLFYSVTSLKQLGTLIFPFLASTERSLSLSKSYFLIDMTLLSGSQSLEFRRRRLSASFGRYDKKEIEELLETNTIIFILLNQLFLVVFGINL